MKETAMHRKQAAELQEGDRIELEMEHRSVNQRARGEHPPKREFIVTEPPIRTQDVGQAQAWDVTLVLRWTDRPKLSEHRLPAVKEITVLEESSQ